MDTKVMKWMEQMTCKDIAKKIDEMIIKDYAKEWKSVMFKSNTIMLIEQVFIIIHQLDGCIGFEGTSKLQRIYFMKKMCKTENGLINIYMNSLGLWYINKEYK